MLTKHQDRPLSNRAHRLCPLFPQSNRSSVSCLPRPPCIRIQHPPKITNERSSPQPNNLGLCILPSLLCRCRGISRWLASNLHAKGPAWLSLRIWNCSNRVLARSHHRTHNTRIHNRTHRRETSYHSLPPPVYRL